MPREQWEVYDMGTGKAVSDPMSKTAAERHLNDLVLEWRAKSNGSHTAPKNCRWMGRYVEVPRSGRMADGTRGRWTERVKRLDGPIMRTFKYRQEVRKQLSIRSMSEKEQYETERAKRDAESQARIAAIRARIPAADHGTS